MEEEILKYNSVKTFKLNTEKTNSELKNLEKGLIKFYQKVNEEYKKNGKIEKNYSFKLKTSRGNLEERVLKILDDKSSDLFGEELHSFDFDNKFDIANKKIINFIENSHNYVKEGISEINKNGGFFKDKIVGTSDLTSHFKPNGKPTKTSKKSKIKDISDLSYKKRPDQIVFWLTDGVDTLSSIHHIMVNEPKRYGVKYPKSEKIFEEIVSNLDKIINKYDKEMINYNKREILKAIQEIN